MTVLLDERVQEVDGHLDVDKQLLLRHFDVTDGDSQAKNLLKLELDLGLDVVDLVLERLVVSGERTRTRPVVLLKKFE